ncbi:MULTISPECIES: hypothetical protein [unclassified Halomonas]|uniref:hypothetical protein n=1 Tax=unclassified Halomonas TaxID=2609666 RepID=UPI00209CB15C|nr:MULTISPECIES: hypothetical protein [unclassified Halomonas]MCP1312848.1 hypothetical protein [Halomonas sp. 707D7]MCP1325645.1 hypothetical protein [Halomonas sp. 707D4]
MYTEDNFNESAFSKVLESVQELLQKAGKLGVLLGIESGVSLPLHSADKAHRLVKAAPSNGLQIIFNSVNLLTSDNYHDQQVILETAIHQWGVKMPFFTPNILSSRMESWYSYF